MKCLKLRKKDDSFIFVHKNEFITLAYNDIYALLQSGLITE